MRKRQPSNIAIAGGRQYQASRFARLARRPRAVSGRVDAVQQALATLIGSMPIRVIMVDRELRLIAASRSASAGMGHSLDNASLIGRRVHDIDPEYFGPFIPICERCLAGETFTAPRVRARVEEGPDVWLRTEISPWRDDRGRIGGVVSVSVDISDMVETVERIKRSEERLNIAAAIADLHVWEADFVNQETFATGASDTFFDGSYTHADMLADPGLSMHPDDRERLLEAWTAAAMAGESFRAEYRINRADDKEVWAAGTTKLIRDEAGQPLRLIGAMQNITGQKQAEIALVQAKEDAEAANRAKSAFLATMSHEIRTPLNGVLGMAQAMAADELTAEQRGRVDVIRQSGETLLTVLNDVLDLSKIEAGKLELEVIDFELSPLARSVRDAFAGVAAGKSLAFALEIDDASRGCYRGDGGRLRQILYNLVSNAVKFTEAGEVGLRVSRNDDTLEFTVTDTGIGIPADRVPRLFNKFEQADASTTRRFGGTGLGLAICRELATLMGGVILARSEEGVGSAFSLIVPLPRIGDETAADEAAAPPQSALDGEASLRVLAAEDNSVNQLVLRTLLQQIGVDPMIVADGAEALAAWRDHPWDLILMDVQMPVMDGPTATRRIRAEEAATGRRRTPIVALTANAMAHQLAEYEAAGMDGLIAKPVKVEDLFATLQAALDGADVSEAA